MPRAGRVLFVVLMAAAIVLLWIDVFTDAGRIGDVGSLVLGVLVVGWWGTEPRRSHGPRWVPIAAILAGLLLAAGAVENLLS